MASGLRASSNRLLLSESKHRSAHVLNENLKVTLLPCVIAMLPSIVHLAVAEMANVHRTLPVGRDLLHTSVPTTNTVPAQRGSLPPPAQLVMAGKALTASS